MRYVTKDFRYGITASPKTGSRTVMAWSALTWEPDMLNEHPDWFLTHEYLGNGYYNQIERAQNVAMGYGKIVTNTIKPQYSVAIIRDPVKRFVSGYKNRIHWHKDLPYGRKPSFDNFVDNFEFWVSKSDRMRVHFKPQCDAIGKQPYLYDYVIDTERLDILQMLLRRDYGYCPDLRLQQGGSDVKITLKRWHIEKIREIYADDYGYWYPHISRNANEQLRIRAGKHGRVYPDGRTRNAPLFFRNMAYTNRYSPTRFESDKLYTPDVIYNPYLPEGEGATGDLESIQ